MWITDVCVPISRLAEAIDQTKRDISASTLIAPIVAHAGDGNFHCFILVDTHKPEEVKAAQELNERMVKRAIAMEGTCTGEHGVGVGKKVWRALLQCIRERFHTLQREQKYLRDELSEETLAVMRSIKQVMDPKNILNPGKVLPEPKSA